VSERKLCSAEGCTDDAIVGLGKKWFCLKHFQDSIKNIGERLATFRRDKATAWPEERPVKLKVTVER
jgi:hypothetical protein